MIIAIPTFGQKADKCETHPCRVVFLRNLYQPGQVFPQDAT